MLVVVEVMVLVIHLEQVVQMVDLLVRPAAVVVELLRLVRLALHLLEVVETVDKVELQVVEEVLVLSYSNGRKINKQLWQL
jgi:hypothetical protein